MICVVCGAENERGARFCSRCGSTLAPPQPATGATVSLDQQAADASSPTLPPSYAPRPAAQPSPTIYQPPVAGPNFDQGARSYNLPFGATGPVTNSMAIIALVLSILSFMVLPFIGSVAGIILGRRAQRDIRASQGRETGEGIAQGAIILGWIHIALFAVLAIGFCLIFLGLFSFGISTSP